MNAALQALSNWWDLRRPLTFPFSLLVVCLKTWEDCGFTHRGQRVKTAAVRHPRRQRWPPVAPHRVFCYSPTPGPLPVLSSAALPSPLLLLCALPTICFYGSALCFTVYWNANSSGRLFVASVAWVTSPLRRPRPEPLLTPHLSLLVLILMDHWTNLPSFSPRFFLI